MEISPFSSSSTPRFTSLRKLLSIVAQQLEEEAGEKGDDTEFNFVSRTFLITINMSPESSPKAQRPVCETAPLAEIAVPMLVSQPELPTHS